MSCDLRVGEGLPFEQQARESEKAFGAFRVYLGMGPKRTFDRVVLECGVNRKSVLAWCKRFDWHGRLRAHGAHLARVEREAAEALARERGVDWADRYERMREEEWRAREELLGLAREAIGRWKESPRRHGSLEGIARLLDLMSELGRRACGGKVES